MPSGPQALAPVLLLVGVRGSTDLFLRHPRLACAVRDFAPAAALQLAIESEVAEVPSYRNVDGEGTIVILRDAGEELLEFPTLLVLPEPEDLPFIVPMFVPLPSAEEPIEFK